MQHTLNTIIFFLNLENHLRKENGLTDIHVGSIDMFGAIYMMDVLETINTSRR